MPLEADIAAVRPHPRPMGVGQIERTLILRTFPGFADLEPDLVSVLGEHTRERFYPRGSYLLRAGDSIESIHFIVQGRVEMRRHGEKYRELGERSAIGGLAAFARDPYGYDVIALEDCVTLDQRVDDAVDIFEDHFPVLQGVLRSVAKEVVRVRREDDQKAGFVETDDPGLQADEIQPAALDFVERMALIRDSMTFARSRVEAIADMAREAHEVRVPTGETLWTEGDPAGDMHIIVSGIVECRTLEGQRFRFGPGDVIGALDGMAQEPRWFTPTVLHDLVALKISTESLYDIFEDNFDIAMDLLEGMSMSLMSIYDKQSGLAPRPSVDPPAR